TSYRYRSLNILSSRARSLAVFRRTADWRVRFVGLKCPTKQNRRLLGPKIRHHRPPPSPPVFSGSTRTDACASFSVRPGPEQGHTMSTTEAQDLLDAIDRCAEEPIHIPGSIQPHGFLLAVDEPGLRVQQASENIQHWLGQEARTLLGQPLSTLIDTGRIEAGLAALAEDDQNPFHLGDVSFEGTGERTFALMAHRRNGQLILEFERAGNTRDAYDTLYPLMRTFVTQLQETHELLDLCQLAVKEVKRITGFGRVKAYRFDADDNGLVLAEEADPGYDS